MVFMCYQKYVFALNPRFFVFNNKQQLLKTPQMGSLPCPNSPIFTHESKRICGTNMQLWAMIVALQLTKLVLIKRYYDNDNAFKNNASTGSENYDNIILQ